jgi:hypothetical protein
MNCNIDSSTLFSPTMEELRMTAYRGLYGYSGGGSSADRFDPSSVHITLPIGWYGALREQPPENFQG